MSKKVNGTYYHPQQAKYAKKYLQGFDRFYFYVPKGEKAVYKQRMEKVGYTNATAFMLDAMDYYFDYLENNKLPDNSSESDAID